MTLWIAGTPASQGASYLLDGALRVAGISAVTVLDITQPGALARLNVARPTVTLALGNTALRAVVGDALPDDDIRELRGYFWDAPCGRVLGTMCPSDIVNDWTPWRVLLDYDVRRARDEVALGAPPLTTPAVTICTNVGHIQDLHAQIKYATTPDNPLSVDIENTHDLKLACVGFAPTIVRAWVIPAGDGGQLAAIRELCESNLPKVLQNGQYDRLFLKRFAGITLRNQRFDTQLAWHALNPELAGKKTDVGYKKARSRRTAKSLKFLASIYLRVPYWKNYDFLSPEEQYTLCGRDVCNTLDIALKQAAQLEAA